MDAIKLELESEELLACRACLATDTRLLGIHEQKLEEVFADISGIPVRAGDGLPARVCGACAARLRRAAGLRAQLRAAHALLERIQAHQHHITTDSIRSIDRSSLRLTGERWRVSADSPTPTADVDHAAASPTHYPDLLDTNSMDSDYDDKSDIEPLVAKRKNSISEVKIVETGDIEENGRNKCTEVKIVETDDIVKNSRINFAEVKIVETNDLIENNISVLNDTKIVEKRKTNGVKKEKRKKIKGEKKKLIKVKAKPEVEWVAKKKPARKKKGFRRYFMCEEDYVKFEEKYNIQVVRLSQQEQAAEMAARRRARGYVTALARCQPCGKGFLSAFTYENHLRVHDPAAGAHACGWCGCRFKWPNNLRTHLLEAHELKYVCKQCQRVVRGRHEALLHAEFHAGKTWDCAHCPRSFKKKSTFYTHVRMNHAAGAAPAPASATCGACGETFKGASGLKLHQIKKCNKNNPAAAQDTGAQAQAPAPALVARKGFICEVCGKNCTSLSTLAVHLRAHSGERPHACPGAGCALRFAKKDNMEKHHRVVHLGQRPLVSCGVCGKQLAHAASLKLHVNTVHLKLPAPPRAPRPPRPPRAPRPERGRDTKGDLPD